MSFEGVKIPSTSDDYVLSEVNIIKGEPALKSIDHPFQWSRYCYIPKFNTKGGNNNFQHVLPTGARPVTTNK